jgi:hypothetical protein
MNDRVMNTQEPLIPISHLSLDLGEPIIGWAGMFAERGVEIVLDDLGRPSVPRQVLGELLAERRESEARILEDQRRRDAEHAEVPVEAGVPAEEGLSAVETLMAQPDYERVQDEFGLPRPNFLDEELAESRRVHAANRAQQEAVENAMRVLEGRDHK